MKIKLLTRQPILPKNFRFEIEEVFRRARQLSPINANGVGDCLEVDDDPSDIRRIGYKTGYKFFIRKVENKLWRIWLKKKAKDKNYSELV